ncbi:D-alanyl-D-alanine carboxypeptidase/D-alanyl-D-alanine-endopeptidase [Methanogenium sp. S4BF]|uniref:D-alanyl-D-alanine carboxypeptidase/D-alanyl-D-alanine endopeptidase n=1 Tax=Methanogenium sp. S4BF TaxID=1789226 RepID=UPI0024169385|nr:D-alanyl-D-alanine carboxypeptidase/D-alanyl-D-alanine-endopeptidase [Methanogenium sp. S4BF]WFN35566.1 D-alanyl-D-alanine carboxypeptidase/D-alanyl-D-alanine-endopeptidase [Methanogenium sp. S4BF]
MAMMRSGMRMWRKRISPAFGMVLMLLAVACVCGCTAPPVDNGGDSAGNSDISVMKETIDRIISQERYRFSTWGAMARDTDSGEVLLSLNGDELFTPGSTTKVFTVATALDVLGPDYRFVTPVYQTGDNLVLVASGDLAMGGRAGPGDTLTYTNEDHVDAGAFGHCMLVEADPLAGMQTLAQEVAASGVHTLGDVAIDDRLFREARLMDKGIVTPIVVNDNLIDVTIVPGAPGEPAAVDWRPKSSAYTVANHVVTASAGSEMSVSIPDYSGQQVIEVDGVIPVDAGTVTLTSSVMVPSAFARSLFIDALENAGVAVDAPAAGQNPSGLLPERGGYAAKMKIAELTSPPFSEYAKVTLKVSQNLYANCLLGIIAAHEGYDMVDAGLYVEGEYLESVGVNSDTLLLVDGEGSILNRISPRAGTALTSAVAKLENYNALKDAMPVLGVDGTLATGAQPGDPGYGEIHAKTGTSVAGDQSGSLFVYSRGLLGYMTTERGTNLTFCIYVNNVPGLESMDDLQGVVGDVNGVAVAMYAYF